jgi:hypothetical protein
MHVDLPGKSEPVFRAPRANLSVQNHLYPGRAPFSASRTVRRDPGVHSRLIRAVSIRRAGQSCIWSVLNLGPGTLVTMSNGTGNHEHRREPLYIRPAVLREPDRQPMLPRLYEHAAPTGLVSQIFIRPRERCGPPRDARYRRSTGAEPPRARYNPQLQSSGRRHSLAPSIATESTLIARAGVYRSARLWARWNRAALPPRVLPLGLGCPARKRVVWASGRKRHRVGCQGDWWPSGRSGAGWGRPQGLPWVGGRPRWRSAAPGEAIFARPTFPRLQVPEVWLGGVGVLKSVTFTELCSFDSESSEKKILLIKYVFLLRSTNVTDRWKCLSPPQHGP